MYTSYHNYSSLGINSDHPPKITSLLIMQLSSEFTWILAYKTRVLHLDCIRLVS